MNQQILWLAAAFMLMFEGLMPLVAPKLWRQVFEKVLQLPDGGVRLVGAVSVLSGLALYWLLKV
ncbi:MAG: DUF2065 domain-containing protein [Brachymonas sp.]|nr:DUF2065 domain-containing protein [Brachymonas sp.]